MTHDDGTKVTFHSLKSASKFMKIPQTSLWRYINKARKVGCLFFEYTQK